MTGIPKTIKEPVPHCGAVCSNPKRAERLVERYLRSTKTHTDSWGVQVMVGRYKTQPFFVASVPMGAGGLTILTIEDDIPKGRRALQLGVRLEQQ